MPMQIPRFLISNHRAPTGNGPLIQTQERRSAMSIDGSFLAPLPWYVVESPILHSAVSDSTSSHWLRFSLCLQLNADDALVRDLNPSNTDPVTGFVSCSFNSATAQPGVPPCNVSSTIKIAAEFSDSNDLWLVSNRSAFILDGACVVKVLIMVT